MQAVLVTDILQPGGMGKVMDVHSQERWLMLDGQTKEIENGFERIVQEFHLQSISLVRRL